MIPTSSSTSIKVALKGVYLLTDNVSEGPKFHQLFMQASCKQLKLDKCTLKEDDDAVVDKLVTDDSESIEPPFLRLDSQPYPDSAAFSLDEILSGALK